MKMAAPAVYKLELDPQKKNVFVTQLHDREEEEDVTAFPVVKESGDRLIETGINTLQKTLLLKKEVEIDKVNAELEAKRYDFKQRMEACTQRQIEVQKKQQQMKDRVAKFEKFIQENDAKRRKAIQKYQQEVKLRDQKGLEFSSLSEQLQHYKTRHTALQAKLKEYKVYEEYLQNVIEAMPEEYLPPTEDKIKSLMLRHRTLSESNTGLLNNLESITDELEECKKTLEIMNQEHQQSQLSSTSQLSHLQEMQEEVQDQNEQQEQSFALKKGETRAKFAEIGVVFMAIDNIYEKCKKLTDPPFSKAEWNKKLTWILDHVQERAGVLNMVQSSNSFVSGGSSPDNIRARSRSKTTLKFILADQ